MMYFVAIVIAPAFLPISVRSIPLIHGLLNSADYRNIRSWFNIAPSGIPAPRAAADLEGTA